MKCLSIKIPAHFSQAQYILWEGCNMRVNKIPSYKEKTFSLEGFRGIDMVSGKSTNAKYRPVKVSNMFLSGGTLHKRHGWEEIKKFTDDDGKPLRINGIHNYIKKEGESYFIVHAKEDFYKCSKDFSHVEKIPVKTGNIKDTKTSSFQKEGKLFIIGCGGMLVFDGEKIFDIENSEFCYIPTTSKDVCDFRIGKTPTKADEPNLITKRRRNTMVGIPYKYDVKVGDSVTTVVGYPNFRLDAPCDKNSKKGISAEIWMQITGNSQYQAYTDENYRYEGRVTLKFLITKDDIPKEVGKNASKEALSVTGTNGENIRLSSNSGYDFISPKISFNNLLTTFSFNFSMDMGEENNIVFEFDADIDLYSDTIKHCSFGTVFTTSDNYSHLILSGNHSRPNECYFSEKSTSSPYTYFPVGNVIVSGDERYKICGFLSLSNDEIAILKENSFSKAVFSVSGNKTSFREYTGAVSSSCANEFACQNVNFDSVFFGKNGVFAIDKSSQNLCKSLIRSGNLSFDNFTNEEIKNSFCIENDSCLYLFIKDMIFMCDARYTFYRDDRLDSSFEYEWWIWQNCPSRCATSIDGKIYMGKENGAISVFGDGYCDKELTITLPADILYDYEKQNFTLNTLTDIKEGDKVKLNHHLKLLTANVNYSGESGEIIFQKDDFFHFENTLPVLKIADGSRIRVKSGGVLDKNIYYLCGLNSYLCSGKIVSENGVLPAKIDEIYLEIDDGECEYTVEKDGDGYKFCYFGEKVKLDNTEEVLIITHFKSENVFCEFITPFLHLDFPAKSKSLVSISITPNLKCGKINFGYKTKNTSYISKTEHSPAINFEDLSFKSFSLQGECMRSFVLRAREVNFNYISFFFFSDSNEDCSIEGIYTTFRINDSTMKGMI